MRIYGVTGWKNAGKTGLMERLVAEISARGFSVSTVKHTHHAVDLEQKGTDTHRHRQAGAAEVMLASETRWALMREHRDDQEPDLEALVARMAPVDLILVEGFKRSSHPKVEAYRAEADNPLIALENPTVQAVATDTQLTIDLPQFDLDDTAAVADFILLEVGL